MTTFNELGGDGRHIPVKAFGPVPGVIVGNEDGEFTSVPIDELVPPTEGGGGGSTVAFADVTPGYGVTVVTSGLQDFDDVTGADGLRVLVNRTGSYGGRQATNGLWIMREGAWERPDDYLNAETVELPMVLVLQGTNYSNSVWTTAQNPIVVGSSAPNWEWLGAPVNAYEFKTGIFSFGEGGGAPSPITWGSYYVVSTEHGQMAFYLPPIEENAPPFYVFCKSAIGETYFYEPADTTQMGYTNGQGSLVGDLYMVVGIGTEYFVRRIR